MHFVYMLKNASDKIYIGITTDTARRLSEHNSERGASFTKYGTFRLVFSEPHDSYLSARKREVQIKKWRRDKKGFLIQRFEKGLPTI